MSQTALGEKTLKPLSLKKNLSWTFIGNATYAACQWGMLVVLSKFGTPEMVGKFGLAFAITAPIVLFFNLQLRTIQATDASQQYNFSDYLTLRLISSGLAQVVISLLLVFSPYPRDTSLVIWIVGLAKSVESISDVHFGMFQQKELMNRIAYSFIIKGFTSLLMLALGVLIFGTIVNGVTGILLAWTAVLMIYDIPNAKRVLRDRASVTIAGEGDARTGFMAYRLNFDRAKLAGLTRMVLPLGFVALAGSLLPNIPRYFIEYYLGEHSLGIYASINSLFWIPGTLIVALGQSATPRFGKYYNEQKYGAFLKLLLRLLLFAVGLALFGIAISVWKGQELLRLIFTEEYARHSEILTYIMIASIFHNMITFLTYSLNAMRYLWNQLWVYLFITGESVLLCFYLVPGYGLKGAAMVLIFTSFTNVAISSFLLWRAFRNWKRSAA